MDEHVLAESALTFGLVGVVFGLMKALKNLDNAQELAAGISLLHRAEPTEKGRRIQRQIQEIQEPLKKLGLDSEIKVAYEAIGIKLILHEKLLFELYKCGYKIRNEAPFR